MWFSKQQLTTSNTQYATNWNLVGNSVFIKGRNFMLNKSVCLAALWNWAMDSNKYSADQKHQSLRLKIYEWCWFRSKWVDGLKRNSFWLNNVNWSVDEKTRTMLYRSHNNKKCFVCGNLQLICLRKVTANFEISGVHEFSVLFGWQGKLKSAVWCYCWATIVSFWSKNTAN